jgi:hypothetical protein
MIQICRISGCAAAGWRQLSARRQRGGGALQPLLHIQLLASFLLWQQRLLFIAVCSWGRMLLHWGLVWQGACSCNARTAYLLPSGCIKVLQQHAAGPPVVCQCYIGRHILSVRRSAHWPLPRCCRCCRCCCLVLLSAMPKRLPGCSICWRPGAYAEARDGLPAGLPRCNLCRTPATPPLAGTRRSARGSHSSLQLFLHK